MQARDRHSSLPYTVDLQVNTDTGSGQTRPTPAARPVRPTGWSYLKITSAGCLRTVEPVSGVVPTSRAWASAAGAQIRATATTSNATGAAALGARINSRHQNDDYLAGPLTMFHGRIRSSSSCSRM